MSKIRSKKKKENISPKVLFCFENPRLFRTTLIGYLYELAQVWPVAVIGPAHLGKADAETKELLYDKKRFPKLEEINLIKMPYWGSVFEKNSNLHRKLKNIITRYRPDIIIAPTDMSLMGLYLMRFGKKIGAVNLTLQSGFKMGETKDFANYSYLMNVRSKWTYLPLPIRALLVKLRRYFGHFLYYWILPLTVGEKPFWGKSSSILIKGSSGMRDADYSAVFSKRDYDLAVKDGVPKEKLYILDHPLQIKKIRSFFRKVISSQNYQKSRKKAKVFTLMFPTEKTGFKKDSLSLIPKEKVQESRLRIIDSIAKTLKDYELFIKPHPAIAALPEVEKKEIDQSLRNIQAISEKVKVVSPLEPADKYIEMSDVIIGIPPASTALYTALLQCPRKIILSLDLEKELLGDSYKDFEEIEYIDNQKNLEETLKLIRSGKYNKKNSKKMVKSPKSFTSTVDLVKYLYKKHKVD